MGQIYEKAEKVLIWLGKATPQIISLMETLNQFRNADSGYHYEPEMFKDWDWKDHSIGIKQLLNREWFTRVWILQEVAKARRADVCCGVRSIPTEIFVLALSFVEQKPPPHCQPVLDIMAESFRSSSWWAHTRNLCTLLRKFQGSKATDERDKIYALLGMSSDPLDTKNITIDYRRPPSQVFHEVVTYLLQSMPTNQSNPFTIPEAFDIISSHTTLDVTYFTLEQETTSEATCSHLPSGCKMKKPYQTEAKLPDMAVFNHPTLLLFEERPAESLKIEKTCYSQIVELMSDYQFTEAPRDYDEGLHVLSWGNAEHHIKVVVIRDKMKAILKAAVRGCDQVVKRLLHMKLGIEREEEFESIVLQEIAYRGSKELLQFMLDAGADVNAQGGRYRNALQAAAYNRRKALVRMLLNAGADANAQGGYYGNALQAAAYNGRGDLVRMQYDALADVHAQDGYFESALSANAASPLADEKSVKILLSIFSDFDAQDGYYGNALQAADSRSKEDLVRMLLNAGADVNAQGGYFGSALQGVAVSVHPGKEEIAKILLDAGADVNAHGGKFGNALRAARDTLARTGTASSKMIVEMLLDAGAGADDNDQDGEQGSNSELTDWRETSL